MPHVIYKFDIRFPCMSADSFACDLPISSEDDRLTGLQIKEIAAGFVADGIECAHGSYLDKSIVDTLSAEDWNLIAIAWDEMCDDFLTEWDDETPLLYLHYTEVAA